MDRNTELLVRSTDNLDLLVGLICELTDRAVLYPTYETSDGKDALIRVKRKLTDCERRLTNSNERLDRALK